MPHSRLVQRHPPEELSGSPSATAASSSPGWTVGRRRVSATATRAMRAGTASAARSPLVRLDALASTMAVAVAGALFQVQFLAGC